LPAPVTSTVRPTKYEIFSTKLPGTLNVECPP
jgi:hypothetical protein